MSGLGRDERFPEGDKAAKVKELLDLIEELVGWLRVGTFDEEDGERELRDRARELLARYRRAA